jgi:hypothetical protein
MKGTVVCVALYFVSLQQVHLPLHELHCALYFDIKSICLSLAADIHLNPQANCSPPTGCDFLSTSTWINGTIPASDNGDNIFISNPSTSNQILIVAKDLAGAAPSNLFSIQSIVVQNAALIFDFSLVEAEGKYSSSYFIYLLLII